MIETRDTSILLVEDEAMIAMGEVAQLNRAGYRTVWAASGEKAVEIVRSGRGAADLVLMDINLGPGMDGTEAARAILAMTDIPVVFLSSHMEEEIVRKTEEITNYGYVVKNSSFTVLDASIKMALKLFDAHCSIRAQKMEIEAAYEEMQVANEELLHTQEELLEHARALDESELTFRSLFEKAPIGTAYHRMVYDDAGKPVDYIILDANKSYEELTGASVRRGQRVTELFPGIERDPFDWIGKYGEVARTGVDMRFQQYFGLVGRWYDIVVYRNKPGHFVTAFMDITDRKLAEDRAAQLLRDKDLVLKEAHHRIKNNMQGIGSLLRLQADAQEEGAARDALYKAVSRVGGLAVLYDKLYRSEETGTASMAEYLPSLLEEIAGTYPSGKAVVVESRIDDIPVSAERLSPIGMIVNELVTNAMKHAFCGKPGGRIVVTATAGGGRVRLSVEDDGIGLREPEGDGASPGFGLQLVKALVEQLSGSFAVEAGAGAKFLVEFEA